MHGMFNVEVIGKSSRFLLLTEKALCKGIIIGRSYVVLGYIFLTITVCYLNSHWSVFSKNVHLVCRVNKSGGSLVKRSLCSGCPSKVSLLTLNTLPGLSTTSYT